MASREDGGPSVDARKFFVDGGECPPGYTFDTLGCYRAVLAPNMATWFAAEAACEADVVGAHLVVINDMVEAGIVDRQVPGTIVSHWIGLSDLVTEGAFVGVTNMPITYARWATNEPSGGTAQNCVLFFDDQTLATKDCTIPDDYVCEYDGIPAVHAAWGQ